MLGGALIYIPATLLLSRFMGQYAVLAVQTVLYLIYGIVCYVQTNKLLAGTASGVWDK